MTTITHHDPDPLQVDVLGPQWKLRAFLPPWRGATGPDPELYPVRVLAQDALSSAVTSDAPFFFDPLIELDERRRPPEIRHPWNQNFDKTTKVNRPVDALIPRLLAILVKSEKASELRLDFVSRTGDPAHAAGEIKIDGLSQIIVRPEPSPKRDWPSLRELNRIGFKGSRIPGDTVTLPDTRLVLGDIRCLMKSNQTLARRLLEIEWKEESELRLTPDGIVLQATVPFPGQSEKLEGHFLLYPATKKDGADDTGLRLRLLPDELTDKEAKEWSRAWLNVSPSQSGDSLRIKARPSVLPPAFSWTIRWRSNTRWQLGNEVGVPADWMQLVVIGRRPQESVAQDTDGSAILLAERVTLANGAAAGEVVLEAHAGTGETQLTLVRPNEASADEKLVIAAASGELPLRHGAHELSATLREIQGNREELYGFVAADRGWLQLPLPNVPPPDPELDQDLVNTRDTEPPSVLDGFMRWSTSVDPELVSASRDTELDLARQAPWSITVESAPGFSVTATVTAGTTDHAKLKTWRVELQTPEISTRGLLWLSADRPTANEALPRLGAGPGSFFDVPFEVNSGRQVGAAKFSIARLELDPRKPDIETRRLSMKHDEGSESWAWLRHERMPLAATMPMTRSGGESVKPLESRDLAPFVVSAQSTPLAFAAGSVLADTRGVALERLEDWPWPKADDNGEPLGVAFAVVGIPGAEVQPRDDWSDVQLAVRYDLPLLDEAFATAKLPKDEEAQQNATAQKAPDPPVTALDREKIGEFWEERKRKQELTRVEDSYFLPFDQNGEVANLVSSAKWEVTGRLDVPSTENDPFPYGELVLTDHEEQRFRADAALEGVEATFKLSDGVLTRLASPGGGADELAVRGFAPSTYEKGELTFDNRGFGAAIENGSDGVRTRSVSVSGTEYRLVTVLEPIAIAIRNRTFELWIKDLPIDKDGVFTPRPGVDPKAWTKEQAPIGGYEVRLVDRAQLADPVLSDTFRLWGFDVTFLGLAHAKLSGDATYTLAMRLQLPASEDPLHAGGYRIDVTIKRDGGAWKIQPTGDDPPSATMMLRNEAMRRLMRLDFEPRIAGDDLKLTAVTLGFTQFGAAWSFKLNDETLTPDTKTIALEWETAQQAESLTLGAIAGAGFHGRLAPAALTLTIDETSATLVFDSVLRIENRDQVLLARLPIGGDLELLGLTVPAKTIVEDRSVEIAGGLVRRFDSTVTGELFEGFTEAAERKANGVLAVTFESRETGSVAPLQVIAGHIELEITPNSNTTATTGVAMRAVRLTFSASKTGEPWSGRIELNGSMRLPSAIDWPAKWEMGAPSANLVTVRASEIAAPEERFITHTAEFQLEGQIVPLDALTAGANGRLNCLAQPWHTVVLATHQLERTQNSEKTILRWSSMEPLTLMTLGELVEVQGDNILGNNPRVQAAFVGGHRLFSGTPAENKKALVPVGAIFKPGFGRRADVLGGADNRRFRSELAKELDDQTRKQLVAIAGFAGVLRPAQTVRRLRLLRVPFIARLHAAANNVELPFGLTGKKFTQTADHQQLVMPRHDTLDAMVPKLELTARHAVRPADARAQSLFALLTAERRAVAPPSPAEKLEIAVLAEQAFVSDLTPLSLEKTPFWIGAALAIDELLREATASADLRSLSLVAGRISKNGASPWQSAAVVVALDFEKTRSMPVPLPATELITLGETLVFVPFASRDTARPALLRAALIHHAAPRVVALRAIGNYIFAPVPAPFSADLPQPAAFAETMPQFPQAQRGFARAPFTGSFEALSPAQLAWSSGMIQGATGAIRDLDNSGLAGLATAVALPRCATSIDPGATEGTSPLLWLGEKRAAPYLPLKLTDLHAPPFGWLSVAPPRARLPIHDEIRATMQRAGIDVASKPAIRALLPDSAGIAAVSERAGVLTARRLQLLGRIPNTPDAFDASFSRFGAAAQSSNTPLRQMRTPRPGRLPDERRPVSRFVRGVAERLSGSSDGVAWSAVIVAMPATGGIVSNRWDGSIRLRCRIEFEGTTPAQPLHWLFARQSGTITESQSWLRIGDVVVPFTKMHFSLPAQALLPTPFHSPYVADVLLDFDPRVRVNGLLPQAAALNVVPPPDVELYLLVHPDNGGKTLPLDRELVLTAPGGGALLPGGGERLPVTLNWPLAPVSTERGAVPLRPVSVIFSDAVYDEELTTEPLEARADVKLISGTLPSERGRLRVVFSVDRHAAEIDGRIAVMVDLRFERRRSGTADADPGEDDLDMTPEARPLWLLRAKVIPRDGKQRTLAVRSGSEAAPIRLGFAHELSLASLRELETGNPVQWLPGDRLQLSAVIKEGKQMPVTLRGGAAITVEHDPAAPLSVSLPVSDEPSFEPPPGLYAMLERTLKIEDRPSAISVPLFAQSPQATRVDADKLVRDIRHGLIKRKATFLWRTARALPPKVENSPFIYVMKQDRNGQSHLPLLQEELAELESPLTWE